MKIQSITIVRHGETPWTITGQHTGRTEVELTDHGKEEALKLGKQLRKMQFDQVWTSPSKRARQTCELAGFGKRAVVLNDLAEWDYGDYEGKTSEEIHKKNPGWTVFSEDPPHGESAVDIGKRADLVLSMVEGNVALFSSGHISRVITARFLGFPVSYGKHFMLGPGTISILSFEHGVPVIKLWNCTNF